MRTLCLPLRIAALAMCLSPFTAQALDTPKSFWGLTASGDLVNVDERSPSTVKKRLPISGLAAGDTLVGIDYRVAYGDMYALAASGRIYIIDTSTGVATPVAQSLPVEQLSQGDYGFDFNPAADKLRVVGVGDLNLRLHPETGAIVDFDKQRDGVQTDPRLAFDKGDRHAGEAPDIVAAAYTYNQDDDKLTTNYAIDRTRNVLVMQGSREGATPGVSPNLGVLFTVGPLELGDIDDASMDISDVDNVTFMVYQLAGESIARRASVDAETGKANALGVFGSGAPLRGFAIEP